MAARKKPRQCPRCGAKHPPINKVCTFCNTPLVQPPFRMNKGRIKYVHALAASKGLDKEMYKLRLSAVGVKTCKDLKKKSYHQLIYGMRKLPNVQKRAA